MVVELVLAGALAVFGGTALVGKTMAHIRTLRIARDVDERIVRAKVTTPYRSAAPSTETRRRRLRARARRDDDLMIGRTLYL